MKNIETMAAELVAAVERDWPSSPEHRARVLKAADALSLSLAQASKRGMTTPIKNYGPEFLADLRAEAEAEAQAEAKPAEPSNPVTVYTNRGAAPAAPGQQEAKSVLELLRKARAVIQPDWEDATGEPLAQWCTDADAAIAAPAAPALQPMAVPQSGPCDHDYASGHGEGYAEGWNAAIEASRGAAPAAPAPLTDEQIDALQWGPEPDERLTYDEWLRLYARAVERAHGIGAASKGEQP